MLRDQPRVIDAAVEETGNHRGSAGVAGQQHESGVVAWLGAKVNLWHGRESGGGRLAAVAGARLDARGTLRAAAATACATAAQACGRSATPRAPRRAQAETRARRARRLPGSHR